MTRSNSNVPEMVLTLKMRPPSVDIHLESFLILPDNPRNESLKFIFSAVPTAVLTSSYTIFFSISHEIRGSTITRTPDELGCNKP